MNEQKIKFLNEFKYWTKEEVLSRAFEICGRFVDLTRERDKFSNTLDEIREVIKQPFSNYSSCIKAIDEIEQLIDKNKKED